VGCDANGRQTSYLYPGSGGSYGIYGGRRTDRIGVALVTV
jgi:hypothetical protein